MRYFALATDYDGTLAKDGSVDEDTIKYLEMMKNSGRKLLLVTGRELPELLEVFPYAGLFDLVVAENGALLYNPATKAERLLTETPNEEFVRLIRSKNIPRISVGRAIIATWKPYETIVLEAIRDMGLELQVIFNKDAVMILPSGVNKATGLDMALKELQLSPHNVAAIGDAENDHAFLSLCEMSAAVSNALPMLKERADYTCTKSHGAGVSEFIQLIIENDLADYEELLDKHKLDIGISEVGTPVLIKPYKTGIMLAGTSGGGKSTLAGSFIERLLEKKYQFCIIDPEGDYQHFPGTLMSGGAKQAPNIEEIVKILQTPEQNCVVSLLGLSLENRPPFFENLLLALIEMRAKTGRPHWIIVDETHHMLHSSWAPATVTVPRELYGMMYITVEPEHVAPAILNEIDLVVAIGRSPGRTMASFAGALGIKPPEIEETDLPTGEAVGWYRFSDIPPFRFKSHPPTVERQRHILKYVEGELPVERSFFFKGPQGRLNLRAQNLMLFLQIGDGVDDDTWLYHLHNGDYSDWFRKMIKDEELALDAEQLRNKDGLSAEEGRRLVRDMIISRYTAPQ